MFKNIFIIGICVVGAIEWLKNLLPTKVKENKAVLTIISGTVSTIGAILFVLFGQKLGLVETLDPTYYVNYIIYIGGTVGIVQVNYATLLKLFKAIVERLKAKYSTPIDENAVADEIVDTVTTKVTEAITETVKEATTSKKK